MLHDAFPAAFHSGVKLLLRRNSANVNTGRSSDQGSGSDGDEADTEWYEMVELVCDRLLNVDMLPNNDDMCLSRIEGLVGFANSLFEVCQVCRIVEWSGL